MTTPLSHNQKVKYKELILAVHTLYSYMNVAYVNGDFHKMGLFQRIVDCMVFELYFVPEEFIISSHLCEFKPLSDSNSAAENYKHILKVYKRISNPSHPIPAILLRLYSQEDEINKSLNNQKHSDNEDAK